MASRAQLVNKRMSEILFNDSGCKEQADMIWIYRHSSTNDINIGP